MPSRGASSARDRLRRFFEQNVGRIVDKEQLAEIAGIHEWARRVRELRDDEGMQILSHNDRPDLRPGEYVLASLQRTARASHRIAAQLRARILERDGFTCQICGRGPGDVDPIDPTRRVRLHIDHVDPTGPSTENNLRTLCSACNEGRSNLSLPPSSLNLLGVVRRAGRADQVRVYEWLRTKYGDG